MTLGVTALPALSQYGVCAQREVRNVLAATLVTLLFAVFFWEYGHRDPTSNPEYWVLVKVRAQLALALHPPHIATQQTALPA